VTLGRDSFVRRTAIWVPVAVIGLLASPMALTDRSFGTDWTLHLWLLRQQQWNIDATGHPGLFLSTKQLGVFYPMFAFVGSGIYSLGGYLAIILGDQPILAYKLLYLAGLCLAYGGLTWLAVQRGLQGWRSQIPGLVFVTGSYMVSDLGTRGDLGEFMALASIPFLLAAAYALLTSPRRRLPHLLAVVGAAFVFTGSHNITLLWGTVFLAAVGLLALVAFGPKIRRPVPWRRVGAFVGCAAIGAGLNAWYLFPDLAYGLDTQIARGSRGTVPAIVDRVGFIFSPWRPAYAIRVTVPWMFVAWGIVVAIATVRRRGWESNALFVGLLAIGAGFVVLAVDHAAWTSLPDAFYNIQFTRRLNAYVLLTTALIVIAALERLRRAHDPVKFIGLAMLALISVFTLGLATKQIWAARSSIHVAGKGVLRAPKDLNHIVIRSRTVIPPSWYARDEFRNDSGSTLATPADRSLIIPVDKVHDSTFSGVLDVPNGPAPFRTNISAGPHFVHMSGITAVSETGRGYVVAVRAHGEPARGPIAVDIHQVDSAVLRSGMIVSLLSALALLSVLVWPLHRFIPTRRSSVQSLRRVLGSYRPRRSSGHPT
jgi:hypothetical protein